MIKNNKNKNSFKLFFISTSMFFVFSNISLAAFDKYHTYGDKRSEVKSVHQPESEHFQKDVRHNNDRTFYSKEYLNSNKNPNYRNGNDYNPANPQNFGYLENDNRAQRLNGSTRIFVQYQPNSISTKQNGMPVSNTHDSSGVAWDYDKNGTRAPNINRTGTVSYCGDNTLTGKSCSY